MKKPSHLNTRSVKTGRFVLSSSRGEKISAVEGMKLSPRMDTLLKTTAGRGLSGDERRALIKEQVRKK